MPPTQRLFSFDFAEPFNCYKLFPSVTFYTFLRKLYIAVGADPHRFTKIGQIFLNKHLVNNKNNNNNNDDDSNNKNKKKRENNNKNNNNDNNNNNTIFLS